MADFEGTALQLPGVAFRAVLTPDRRLSVRLASIVSGLFGIFGMLSAKPL